VTITIVEFEKFIGNDRNNISQNVTHSAILIVDNKIKKLMENIIMMANIK
jgi:hypothetical protein